LLRLYTERNDVLNDDARQAIKITLDRIAEYKRYRDNIAHSVPYDIDKGIAHTVKYGAELMQQLVDDGGSTRVVRTPNDAAG
jgi:hypothetical protein